MVDGVGGEAPQQPWLEGVECEPGKDPIRSRKRYVQVVAGQGFGKTFGLKRRVQRLVKGDGVDPQSIFVGTFTRAIRAELAAALAPPSIKLKKK
jgi:superfamily I DNA/RNA helicase